MKYDFTTVMDRTGKDAIALDAIGKGGVAPEKPKDGFDVIPMWIADMNFSVVPTITKALTERISHPAYGYFSARDEYFDSIIDWQKRRNGVNDLCRDHIGYENGVLGCLMSTLGVVCSKGDNILLHSPTYVGFTSSIENYGYNIILSPLVRDEKGIFRMDYADMEEKIVKHNIHATVFCSPHNPSGRVWERSEIEKAMEIFKKHDVFVFSDEIWSDIILTGHRHIPTQSVNEDAKMRTVAAYAPSKTFNIAGLVGSYHIIYNKWLRDRVNKESSLSHYNSMNVLSMHALIGAYKEEGHEWVDELCKVIEGNVDYACSYIENHFEGVTVSRPQGTYMIFVDCTKWCENHNKTLDDIEKAAWEVGVALQDGRAFHGHCHLRINLAIALTRVKEAFDRLDKYVFNI